MTPLQSPEYAALIAAKEASGKAYAALDRASDKLALAVRAIADATNETQEAVNSAILDAASEVCFIRVACVDVYDADVTIRQAAFDTAYPAPTEVVDAVTAAQAARAELVRIGNELADSYTPAQLDLMNAKDDTQAALDAAVTTAKALIEAAQVSPCKAFVVRSSTKMVTDNMGAIEEAIFGDDLPSDLLAVDQKALQKYMSEHPLRAEAYQVKFEQSVSVAFYAAKL